jgi:hypothetical protein
VYMCAYVRMCVCTCVRVRVLAVQLVLKSPNEQHDLTSLQPLLYHNHKYANKRPEIQASMLVRIPTLI